MQLEILRSGSFSLPVIDGFFSPGEEERIKNELRALMTFQPSTTEKNPGAYNRNTGEVLVDSNSFFLDPIYEDRSKSDILTILRKIFCLDELPKILQQESIFFRHIHTCTLDATLLNYYKKGQKYKPHKDDSIFSILYFITLEDFVGGDLTFPEFGITVEPKNNRAVIFPGCVIHESTPIQSGLKCSIAQFLNYRNKE
jgi:Rps23 Pro-64 3,4-dihydroxylase Tpa1-like proline 4-hydroxylase